ncbi:MAG: sulfatase-like hydrolase/transferase, partial [Betaproteobacteria bacterium]|nr:sulfatase-like hydrolase/transferase [Betaproteobacteria bacterium]
MKLFTKYRTDLFFAGMLFCTACAILVSCSYSLESTVFACSFLLLPFSFLLSVTGQFLRSIAFASAIIISVYMLDRLKDHYYTSPLLFPDFQILMDSNNWETMVQYPWVGLVFILLFVLLAYSVSLSRKKDKRYGYMIRSSGVVVIILCVMLSNYFSHSELTKQDWEKNLTVRRYNNTFSNLIMSVNGFTYQSPKIVADDRLFKQSLAALPVSVLSEGVDGKLPNIIVWLQESTVNPQIFDIPCAQWPKLTMFEPQSDTVVTNWLRVHTFGGGTWKSEFTLLSGLPSTDFGSSAETVYYNVTPHLSYSLPKFLKEKGYYTIVLIATEKNAYNANNAYRDLGFDLVLQPQDIGLNVDKNQNLWKTSSSEMARYTKNVLSVYPNKPVFIFMLTVREHGPYDSTKIPAYGLDQCMNTKAAGSL